eukprot:1406215-Rhodomonas_salina.1
MRYTRKREFNSDGGFHKLVNVFTPVTEAEYDEQQVAPPPPLLLLPALTAAMLQRINPEICRPFSHALGDFRNARQCLASHDLDKKQTLM